MGYPRSFPLNDNATQTPHPCRTQHLIFALLKLHTLLVTFFYLLSPRATPVAHASYFLEWRLSSCSFSTYRITRAGDGDSPIDLSARVRHVHLVFVAFHDALWLNTATNQRCNTF